MWVRDQPKKKNDRESNIPSISEGEDASSLVMNHLPQKSSAMLNEHQFIPSNKNYIEEELNRAKEGHNLSQKERVHLPETDVQLIHKLFYNTENVIILTKDEREVVKDLLLYVTDLIGDRILEDANYKLLKEKLGPGFKMTTNVESKAYEISELQRYKRREEELQRKAEEQKQTVQDLAGKCRLLQERLVKVSEEKSEYLKMMRDAQNNYQREHNQIQYLKEKIELQHKEIEVLKAREEGNTEKTEDKSWKDSLRGELGLIEEQSSRNQPPNYIRTATGQLSPKGPMSQAYNTYQQPPSITPKNKPRGETNGGRAKGKIPTGKTKDKKSSATGAKIIQINLPGFDNP